MLADVVPRFETSGWFGLCGPRGLPPAIVQRWEEAIRTAVNDPEVSRKLLDNGMVPAFRTPPASPAPWTRIAVAIAR